MAQKSGRVDFFDKSQVWSKLTPEYDNDRRKARGKNENNENVISATCLVLYDDNDDSDLMAVCWPVHFKKASHLLLMVAFTQKLC